MHSISKGENCVHPLSAAAALRTQLEPLLLMKQRLENKSCSTNDDHKHKTCTDKTSFSSKEAGHGTVPVLCVCASRSPAASFLQLSACIPFPDAADPFFQLLTIVSVLPASLRQGSQVPSQRVLTRRLMMMNDGESGRAAGARRPALGAERGERQGRPCMIIIFSFMLMSFSVWSRKLVGCPALRGQLKSSLFVRQH